MALLFHDGFDACHSANGQNVDSYFLLAGWAQGSGISAGGRLGTGKAIQQPSSCVFLFAADLTTVILGIADFHGAGGNYHLVQIRESSAIQFIVEMDRANRRLNVYRGNGVALLGQTAINSAPDNEWHFWEVKAFMHTSTGSVELRKDGVTILTLTGVNNCQTGVTNADAFLVGGNTNQWIDDVYLCDNVGALNNDLLGDCASIVLDPNADGTLEQWTRSSGADSWALVDEAPHNADTDYIEAGANTQVTRFLYTDVPALDTVLGITQSVVVKKTDVSTVAVRLHQFISSTAYNGPTVVLGTSYVGVNQLMETNPNTGVPWTPAIVNAAEFGVEAVI